jgi:hypothetical protein
MQRRLDFRDHEMHDLRNRALRCVLKSILKSYAARLQTDRARELASSSRLSPWDRLPGAVAPGPARTSHLRLVKK